MRYDSVEELENIGRAGAKLSEDEYGWRGRYLSSFWLYLEPEDQAFTPHWPTGYWESWTSQWLSTQWEEHNCFFDIGANVGYFTLQAAQAGIKTISVEPNPRVRSMLQRSLRVNRINHELVETWEIALSDHRGQGTLWVPEGHSGGATIERAAEGFDVDIYPLDQVLPNSFYLMNRHLLFKIDAEGSEPKIWDGMQKTLKASASNTVLLEWHGMRYDKEAFAEKLSRHHLTVLQYDGTELPIDYDWLVAEPDLQMVCVRTIKENL